jgi:hypothetical protein
VIFVGCLLMDELIRLDELVALIDGEWFLGLKFDGDFAKVPVI